MERSRQIGENMVLFLLLLTALVLCLLGMGTLCVLYGGRTAREWKLADVVLTGGMIWIGLAEAAHLTAVILGWSFSRCTSMFLVGSVVLCLVAALIWVLTVRKRGKAQGKGIRISTGVGRQPSWLAFGVIAVLQLIYVGTMQGVSIAGDMTLETVNSFLESNAVYEVNPLTGNFYTQGMPFRLKILCLPTLYGSLCRGFGISPELLVYGIVPMLVLIGSFLAYSTLAEQLFCEDSAKRGMLLLFVALLFALGDYMPGMPGFDVLHSGFRGTSIREAVLLPYTVSLMLRRKYKLVVLCVLAEACIVWTLYGMGACMLVAAALAVLGFVMRVYEKHAAGREDTVCRSS